jgi:sporulation protein YlmC with PRC-barrel domain
MGWSVKKTLLGKTVYDDAAQKVGKVDDLIISPDRSVSYAIVGAGGFVGLGRRDVAIAASRIEDKAGRLVMAGATQGTIKDMPQCSDAPRLHAARRLRGRDEAGRVGSLEGVRGRCQRGNGSPAQVD